MAEDYLGELYALQVTFDSINQRYFDGQPGLFPGSAVALTQLVEHAEKLVNAYNWGLAAELELLDNEAEDRIAKESKSKHTTDLSNLSGRSQIATANQAAYLVDMAKAEALDAMGEREKATRLVDQHI